MPEEENIWRETPFAPSGRYVIAEGLGASALIVYHARTPEEAAEIARRFCEAVAEVEGRSNA